MKKKVIVFPVLRVRHVMLKVLAVVTETEILLIVRVKIWAGVNMNTTRILKDVVMQGIVAR